MRDKPKFRHAFSYLNTLARRKKHYIEFVSITHGYAIAFTAFLTKLSQGYTTAVQEIEGGGAPISPRAARSGGLRRKIDLSFQIPAESSTAAVENLQKLSLLVKMLYPLVTPVKGGGRYGNDDISSPGMDYAAAAVWELKFANLISDSTNKFTGGATDGVYGIIKDFNMDFDIDSGFVEGTAGNIYPKLVNVSLELLIIQVTPVGWVEGTDGSTPIGGFEKFPFDVEFGKAKGRFAYVPSDVQPQITFDPPATSTAVGGGQVTLPKPMMSFPPVTPEIPGSIYEPDPLLLEGGSAAKNAVSEAKSADLTGASE